MNIVDISQYMRPDTRLLWIRTTTPGPDYVGVFESLHPFVIQVAHSASEALARLEAEPADVVLAEFPLAAWIDPTFLSELGSGIAPGKLNSSGRA